MQLPAFRDQKYCVFWIGLAYTMYATDKWEGGDLCGSLCIAEHGSTASDAWLSYCFPCATFADIKMKQDPSASWSFNFGAYFIAGSMGAASYLLCYTRKQVNPRETCCCNCLSSFCCSACALVQTLKTVNVQIEHESSVVDNSTVHLLGPTPTNNMRRA